MTETTAIHSEGSQGLSAWRALAHALFAALVVAHTQPLFVTAAAVIPGFGQDFAVSLPLLAAGWVHDFVWLGILGSLLAFAASRAGATPETLRALLLALLVAVLAGTGLATQLDLGILATWTLVFGVGSAAFAAFGLALRPSAFGFTLAVLSISLACGYSNALPTDVATTVFNYLGGLALAWAVLWATRSLRAPTPLFVVIVVFALGAIAESNWLGALSLGSPPPRGERDASANATPVSNAPNLILIVLDTVRADAFDAAANGNTPHLAAFASEARVAHRARSTSSWTLPAHASLFTGSYPTTHGAHFLPRGTSEREAGILADTNTTFAELLQARGYATWGVVANHAYLHADTNIDQGFQIWDDRYALGRDSSAALSDRVPRLVGLGALGRLARWVSQLDEAERQHLHKAYRLAPDVNTSALALLDRERNDSTEPSPFFLFLNYMETHAPYVPRANTRATLGGALHAPWLELHDGIGGIDPKGPGGAEVMHGDRELHENERAHIDAAYRGEAHDLDTALGELFAGLRERGLYNDAWIVITGDHGEFRGEHRLLGHASELYEEAIRIPLLVKHPNGANTQNIAGNVQLVDILPSLAPHFEIDLPAQVEGKAFDSIGDRAAIAEHFEYPQFVDAFGPRFAGNRKAWIEDPLSFYSFSERDPEWHGPANVAAEAQARMQAELSHWLSQRRPVGSGVVQPGLSTEERKRLERLGYL